MRLDLDRSYYAGETVQLQFSLHATHLYEVNGDGSVNYEFTRAGSTRPRPACWSSPGPRAMKRASTA